MSPVTGQVLRVKQESQANISGGTDLLEVGDATDLEAVIDVLSRDAVNVRPGSAVLLERWGGQEALTGVVRRVEPSGFTKVSALGVEEQRVNVIVDFADSPRARAGIGDGYRVDARIITWERPDVLKVPTGALLRRGDAWYVFVVENGRAVLRRVKVGHMSRESGEVLDGLADGDEVVLHPSDRVENGIRVKPRELHTTSDPD
jgi:HlyD family secretion protein